MTGKASATRTALTARDDLRAFGDAVGVPLEPWQVASLTLETRFSILLAPRQSGKSRSLGLLALHRSLVQRNHHTLLISAGEDAARRLLAQVRTMLGHVLLSVEVVTEEAGLIVFRNGSSIRAVPASERQVRGLSVDLLILDEASFISDDLIYGAALPTIAARPDAKVVLSSTPWQAAGGFWAFASRAGDPEVSVHRWALKDAWWISPSYLEQMRTSLPEARWRAEFEAEFVDGGTGLFSRAELMNAVAPYSMVSPERARGGSVLMGCDWGRMRDSHAISLVGVLDDYGANPGPVLFLAWQETSQQVYRAQTERILKIAKANPSRGGLRKNFVYETARMLPRGSDHGYRVEVIYSEVNGSGRPGTEDLTAALGEQRVHEVNTTQASKELTFSRLNNLLTSGQMVLPNFPELLRELSALEATQTRLGGLTIAAPAGHHDDRSLSLSFTMLGVPTTVTAGRPSRHQEAPPEDQWVKTPNGVLIPQTPRPRWGGLTDSSAFLRGADHPI